VKNTRRQEAAAYRGPFVCSWFRMITVTMRA